MHTASITGIGTDAAGTYVVTGSLDRTVRVWNARSGACLGVIRPAIGDGDEGKVYTVALSPDGQTIAAGGFTDPNDADQSLYLFERATGRLLRRVTGLPNVICSLTYSPDGHSIAVALGSEGVRLFRASDGVEIGRDTEYGETSEGIAFSSGPGPPRLAATCDDGYVRLYDITPDGLALRAKVRTQGGSLPYGIAFSPSGTKIAVGYLSSTRVSVLSGTDLSRLYAPDTSGIVKGDMTALCWSGDGQALYAAGGYAQAGVYRIRRWAAGGRGAYKDFPIGTSSVSDLKPRPQGGVFFATGAPAWGALDAGGRRVLSVEPANASFQGSADSLRVSADGTTVAFACQPGGDTSASFSLPDRRLTEGTTGSRLRAPILQADALIVRDWEGTAAPLLNGTALALEGHEYARCLALAPDHESFLLGTDWYLRCFSRDGEGKWSTIVPASTGAVNVSGDGRLAVATCGDGTTRWYRMSDGKELLALFAHADRKRWAAWTPSGYYDCSSDGEDLIGWHVNRGPGQVADFFPAARFRSTFHRPDVVARILSTLDEQEALRQADAAAGRKK